MMCYAHDEYEGRPKWFATFKELKITLDDPLQLVWYLVFPNKESAYYVGAWPPSYVWERVLRKEVEGFCGIIGSDGIICLDS